MLPDKVDFAGAIKARELDPGRLLDPQVGAHDGHMVPESRALPPAGGRKRCGRRGGRGDSRVRRLRVLLLLRDVRTRTEAARTCGWPPPAASQEMVTSVLQPQGTRFCLQPEGARK